MVENIKVSVVLTSYNHGKHLRQAIDSVLTQTFSNFELIIIDDGSTDESWEIINSYSDPRVRAFLNKDYKPGTEFFKRIFLNVTSGEYIAIHHSDDLWERDKLEKQVSFLTSHAEIGAVFTWVKVIDENGNSFEDTAHPYYKIFEQPNRTRQEWLHHFFYRGNALCHPSVLIRRVCYETCGAYRFGFAQLGDFDMWVRLCLRYEIYILPERLTSFRVRSGETNASGNRPSTAIRMQFELFQILHSYLQIPDPIEFVKIFPDSSEYFKQKEYDIDFALAMSAIKSEHNFSKLLGLNLLWRILNDDSKAKKVKALYGFSNRDLTQLTAQHDVFSVAKLIELYTSINQQTAVSQSLMSQLREKEKVEQTLFSQLREHERALAEIKNSRSWRIAQVFQKAYNWLLPPGSFRARIMNKLDRMIFSSRSEKI